MGFCWVREAASSRFSLLSLFTSSRVSSDLLAQSVGTYLEKKKISLSMCSPFLHCMDHLQYLPVQRQADRLIGRQTDW